MQNFNISPEKGTKSTEEILTKLLPLVKYYQKYRTEFETLQQEYRQLNNGFGVMLQLAFDDKALKDHVYLAKSSGSRNTISIDGVETNDPKVISKALREGKLKDSDYLEFCYIATNQRPGNGIEVYPFHNADDEKVKKYYQYRDELFAKIKKEYQRDKR